MSDYRIIEGEGKSGEVLYLVEEIDGGIVSMSHDLTIANWVSAFLAFANAMTPEMWAEVQVAASSNLSDPMFHDRRDRVFAALDTLRQRLARD
jgi:hypothetical protein